ncbi:facilitated trehalose transporter Tret1-2 homolog [Leptopilina heterotoma]|uniref:facilitated trehalose transporter Tret1-2 homolog n=1 Tax=Leptopilina heterotoma TaxID=63436 RepID=UPI001CA8611B|nr:facilitated trehalose transporter Tret1-2 homolog [Leptopilina heterotoma]
MTPTNRNNEEIEGQPYKEYVYSPVPVSSTSAVHHPTTTLTNFYKNNTSKESQCVNNKGYHHISQAKKMAEKGSKFLQYLAATTGNLCIVATGAMLGWTSPILPRLQEDNPLNPDNPLNYPVSKEEASWIGSLVPMGAIFGCFAAGILVEKIGRKKGLLFSTVPFLIGWILVASARSIYQLYVARLIFGFALAVPFTILPMYIGEIAETSIRGSLGSFLQLFITIGLLFSYAIGPYVSYMVLWIACGSLPIIFFISFLFMPESPYFLLGKGQKEDAIKALARLRGKSTTSVQKEADEMQATVDAAFRTQTTLADLFKVKANFKALLFTCALVSFQQLTGINVVLIYAEGIFKSTGTSLSTSLSTIILGVVQVLASAVTPLVIERLGRRILLVISGVGTAVTLGALGLFFFLKDVQHDDVESISWLPVVSLVIYISLYSIGWGPLPWAVMGEMFASDVKAKASGITVFVCWGLAFIITKFFSNIESAFGTHTAFWIFSACCVVAVLFAVLILPETKGKSLQEIQDELNGIRPAVPNLEGGPSSKL